MEPQAPPEVTRPLTSSEINQRHATFLSVYDPERGYLCQVQKPLSEGAPRVIKPIQSLDEDKSTGDPYVAARKLTRSLTKRLFPNSQFKQSPFLPMFRKDISVILPQDDSLEPPVRPTETSVFDVLIDSTLDFSGDDDYMFVSEKTLLEYGLVEQEDNTEIYIHPDCEQLIKPKSKPLEIAERTEPSLIRGTAKNIIRAIENVDKIYDTAVSAPDRLTLEHIEALRAIIPDTQLIDDLETAYIREKLIVLGFQQMAALSFQGLLTSSIIHNNDVQTTFALVGAIGTEYYGTPGKKDEMDDSEDKRPTLKKLLVQALDKGVKAYKLKKSQVEGLDNPAEFVHELASDLSEPDALKSKVAAKWGAALVNSSVLFANNRTTEMYAYAGSSIALNIFGEVYRKKLQEKAEHTSRSPATPLPQRIISKLFRRSTGRLVQAGVSYSSNALASLTGLSGPDLELGINLITAIGMNESDQVSQTPDSVERTGAIQALESFITWAGEQAAELNTDEQYAYYASQRGEELAHAPIKSIHLPDTDILTHQTSPIIEHRPADIQRKRTKTSEVVIEPQYVVKDAFNTQTTEEIVDRYPFIEQAVRAKYAAHNEQLTTIPHPVVVYTDLSIGDPQRKMFLHNANLVLTPGKIVSIGGKVSSPILEALAERRRTMSGTTYISHNGQEKNVHLDNDRRDFAYHNCDKSGGDVHFFPGMQKDDILVKLRESGLFTKDELEKFDLEEHAQPFSRSTDRRCAVIEALSGNEAVVVLNYQFKDLNEAEIIKVAKYLHSQAQDKIIIIRGEETNTDSVEDTIELTQKTIPSYRRYLERLGAIESYEIVNTELRQATPIAEQYVYALDHMGNPEVADWDEATKLRFANELVEDTSRIEQIDGIPTRKVEIVRADIFTTHNGKRYRLKADYKVEPGTNGAKRTDRSGDTHSFFRSLKADTNPTDTFQRRLNQIGWNVDVSAVPMTHISSIRKSNTFKGLPTQYNYYDASVEVPYIENPIGEHDSGGFMIYKWEEVPPTSDETHGPFDPTI